MMKYVQRHRAALLHTDDDTNRMASSLDSERRRCNLMPALGHLFVPVHYIRRATICLQLKKDMCYLPQEISVSTAGYGTADTYRESNKLVNKRVKVYTLEWY